MVAADEREDLANTRGRATLNYGHTLAHALETGGRYDLRHGEAVAVGLVYAAELAHRLGRIDRARVDEHRRVVARVRPADDAARGRRPDRAARADGARQEGGRRPDVRARRPRRVEVVTGVDPAAAAAALDDMAGRS